MMCILIISMCCIVIIKLQEPRGNMITALIHQAVRVQRATKVQGLLIVFMFLVVIYCVWAAPLWLHVMDQRTGKSKLDTLTTQRESQ